MLHVILNLTCLLNLKTKLQSLDRKYPLHQSINSLNAVLFTNVYVFGKSSIISLLICSVGRMTCDRKGFVFEKYIFSLDFSKFDIILKFSWSVSQMFFFSGPLGTIPEPSDWVAQTRLNGLEHCFVTFTIFVFLPTQLN